MRRVALCAGLMCAALTLAAAAEEKDPLSAWRCFDTLEDLTRFETDGAVRLNNISLREAPDFMSGVPRITFKASIANRGQSRVVASVELIGTTGGSSAFALSARPAFDMVKPGDNAELIQSIFAEKGTLATTSGGCIKVLIFPAK